ncbi:MAG: hypothetical protein Q4E17_07485 [Synergistes sp.]|nr:hypothetical protein [Synergistes sp.]
MSNHYRLNVRFDLDDEAQRRAAEYLSELNNEKGKSRNRFIVEAVISFMERQTGDRDFTLDDVRKVFREELSEVSFVAPAPMEFATADTELTEEQQAENDENVLSDLSAFF